MNDESIAMGEESRVPTQVYRFTLSREDYGQLRDGISARREAWAKTAAWHRGELDDPSFVVEDSRDEEEAQAIADDYARILQTLRKQVDAQR